MACNFNVIVRQSQQEESTDTMTRAHTNTHAEHLREMLFCKTIKLFSLRWQTFALPTFPMRNKNRQPTHSQRSLSGIQRPLRPEQEGHVGRAEGVSGGACSSGVDSRQAIGEIQEGPAGER